MTYDSCMSESELDELGEDGWELIIINNALKHIGYIFKREKQ